MSVPLTLVLAEDHQVVRAGLRALLETQRGWRVIGEAEDGLAAVELVAKLRPHVLLTGLMMTGLGGLEVIRRVRARAPQTRVVVLSMHAREAYVAEALRAGASAYVLKDSPAESLLLAIARAHAGKTYVSPPLSRAAVRDRLRREAGEPADPYETLTPREREVLHLAAAGATAAAISRHLGISPRTVETHRANLLRKLGLHGQTDLVRFAMERGLLQGRPGNTKSQ